tara:strand:- start:1192 stop:2874 length:1683 start_codon:yes stop_codon:yes gene_type:complete
MTAIYRTPTNSQSTVEPLSILENNQLTTSFEYTVVVDNAPVVVTETIDIDTQNGNYGRPIKTSIVMPDGQIAPLSPDSLVGKSIQTDINDTRSAAYINKMNEIGEIAETQTVLNKNVHDNALLESGMSDVVEGDLTDEDKQLLSGAFPDPLKNQLNGAAIPDVDAARNFTPAKHFQHGKAKGSENLVYPWDMDKSQDYIYIEAFEYKAPQAGNLSNRVDTGKPETHGFDFLGWAGDRLFVDAMGGPKVMEKTGSPTGNMVPGVVTTSGNQSWSDAATKGLDKGGNVKKFLGSVRLPIPNKIAASTGVDWGEGRVNALEAGAFMAVQDQITGVLGGNQNIAGAMKAGVDGLKETWDNLPEIGKGQSGQLISSVLSKAALNQIGINVDPSQMIARSTGMAINPNLELLFSAPKLRTFTFVFQFAPDDENDAIAARKVQRFFKQGMLPNNAAGKGGEKLYLGSPNVYRLCYKNNGRRIKGLNIFKICALTAVEIDFTPENVYQAYSDDSAISMPVRSNMSMTFTELTPIFSGDYDDGSTDPSLQDLGLNIQGENDIAEDDIGF